MDRTTFLTKMLGKGKITQVQYDTLTSKNTAKKAAKEKYKKDKSKLNKAELQALLDTLTD